MADGIEPRHPGEEPRMFREASLRAEIASPGLSLRRDEKREEVSFDDNGEALCIESD
jgi:hypothetical protein